MKIIFKAVVSIIILIGLAFSNAQEIEGSWTGAIQGMPIVFEISKINDDYTAKLQSPSQSKIFLPMDSIVVAGRNISLVLNAYKIKYKGQLEDGKINGTFSQGGFTAPMVLEKKAYVETKPNRPQEPKGPFPYVSEDIFFINHKANNIQLAGTLSIPSDVKQPPVAIMITGSGGQNRDEEILGHKPFLVIADYLTKNGIAVLRFDDRGVGQSQGSQKDATSADFATDVQAAIDYLKTRDIIDRKKIGLIGHSEGGLIAAMVTANNKKDVAFFVSLAGTGVQGDEVLLTQIKKSAQLQGAPEKDLDFEMELMEQLFKKIVASKSLAQEELKKDLEVIIKNHTALAPSHLKPKYNQDFINLLSTQFSDPWMRYFLATDPSGWLEKITCPALILNGSLDYQVIAAVNLPGFKSAFAKARNNDTTLKEITGLNHLFQNAVTGGPEEYGQIEETFDPATLELIAAWINDRF
jgi:pimeloyl-ACP methyl ester carboxylesterase